MWLGPAYRAHHVDVEVEDAPGTTQLHELTLPLWNHKQGRPQNCHEKTLQ